MEGHYSSDVYKFNLGDGQDVIWDLGGTDKIVFGAGINKDNIKLRITELGHILIKVLDNKGNETGDMLTIQNASYSEQYRIERLEFADGTSMSGDEVHEASSNLLYNQGQNLDSNTRSLSLLIQGFSSFHGEGEDNEVDKFTQIMGLSRIEVAEF